VSEMKSGGFKEMIGIVCIDEIDSFTFQRASHHQDTTHNSEQHHTLNMFLSLLDEGDEDEDGDRIKIFTMATTNLLRVRRIEERRLERSDSKPTVLPPYIMLPSYITNNIPLVASLLTSPLIAGR